MFKSKTSLVALNWAFLTNERSLELTLKSSLACAPRLSFLASAAMIACMAFIIKFCNSNVSTNSVFHTIPLSCN